MNKKQHKNLKSIDPVEEPLEALKENVSDVVETYLTIEKRTEPSDNLIDPSNSSDEVIEDINPYDVIADSYGPVARHIEYLIDEKKLSPDQALSLVNTGGKRYDEGVTPSSKQAVNTMMLISSFIDHVYNNPLHLPSETDPNTVRNMLSHSLEYLGTEEENLMLVQFHQNGMQISVMPRSVIKATSDYATNNPSELNRYISKVLSLASLMHAVNKAIESTVHKS